MKERITVMIVVVIAISVISSLWMASINFQCQTKGEFKTPWWSGKETHYICKEMTNEHTN